MDPGNYIIHAFLAQAYRMVGQEDDARRENDLAEQTHVSSELKLQSPH
jgi:hypothetical protein